MDIQPYYQEDESLHKVYKDLVDALNGEDETSEAYGEILDRIGKVTEIQRVNASIVFEYERDNKPVPWWEAIHVDKIVDIIVKAGFGVAFVRSERGVRGIMVPPKWTTFMIPKD